MLDRPLGPVARPRAAAPLWALLCVSLAATTAARAEDAPGAAPPNDPLLCRADAPALSPTELLRAMALDLTGQLPTREAFAEVEARGEVPEAMIDAMLASPGFEDRVVRHVRALLWASLDPVDLFAVNAGLGTGPGGVLYRRLLGTIYRGGDAPCLDEPARFAPDGSIQTTVDAMGLRREGFVRVRPYWDPTTELEVCAFDAQTAALSPTGTRCDTTDAYADARCGCGPELRWCRSGSVNGAVVRAMVRDVEERVRAHLRADEPYLELFASRRAFVNGPLAYFYRHQLGVSGGVSLRPSPLGEAELPALAWGESDTWRRVELPEAHAGILTSPVWLLRFQTNRARAAHFYDAFLCAPISPPATGFPPTDAAERPDPDLQRREGCKYCHALLEPTGAYWARWPERGAGYLDAATFPAHREDCQRCAVMGVGCSTECRSHYLTRTFVAEERPYFGTLNGYVFLRPEHRANAERGPKQLVLETSADGRLPRCAAEKWMSNLFGRALTAEDQASLDGVAARFVQSGWRYRELVKAVVTSPVYRRVR
jgi:hypothetical protein